MQVLVTGATGYIGSHIVVTLIQNGYEVVGIDDLSNSDIKISDNIEKITKKRMIFYIGDVKNEKLMDKIFEENSIKVVIHCAGYKSVKESIKESLKYYDNNLISTINLLKSMEKYGCKNIIFSSSATVYGENKYPVSEEDETGRNITNPYGKTKYFIEEILKDLSISDKTMNITILRYFNPIGSHESRLLDERTDGYPNNLFPYIKKVYNGEIEKITIYGDDYRTKDGTCERDFIHVIDLSEAHVNAIKKMEGLKIYNVGTGKTTSVLELIKTFEKINDTKINYEFGGRRDGDLEITYAKVEKIEKELGWKNRLNINDMVNNS